MTICIVSHILSTCSGKCIVLLSICSIFCGLLTSIYNEDIFDLIIKSQMVIKTGTEAFNAWEETSIPAYTKFYFFHILNPKEFLSNGSKPMLEERGPYTFRQQERKVNITWNSDHTVSYGRQRFWYFEPSLSVGPLTDTLTTINMPAVGAAEFAKGDYLMEFGMSDLLATIQAELFVTKPVGELLFEGYSDPIIQLKYMMEGEEEEEEEMDDWMMSRRRRRSSPLDNMDKFGWFYQRNGSSRPDGRLRMHTGEGGGQSLGKLVSWEGSQRTQAFPGECGQIRGSADGLFPPGIGREAQSLEFYATDICRTLEFVREESPTSYLDIKAQRFLLSPTVFANASVCPKNSCYGNLLPTGVQNVTQCKVKAPSFVSRPHFYLADPFYQAQFQAGVQPRPELHESSLLLEPQSSIPLRVEMRLQINILLDQVPGIQYLFRDLPRLMFPVFWFDTVFALTEETAGPIHTLLALPFVLQVTGIAITAFGIILLAAPYFVNRRHKEETDSVADSDSGDISVNVKLI